MATRRVRGLTPTIGRQWLPLLAVFLLAGCLPSSAPGTPTAVPVPAPRVAIRRGWRHREAIEGFLWIAPAFLYLAFFIAYPFFMAIFLSVSSARVGSPDWHFAGLQNYTRLFQDPVFWQTVQNSFVFTLGSEAIRHVIGLPLIAAIFMAVHFWRIRRDGGMARPL